MPVPTFPDVSPAVRRAMQGNKAKGTKPEMIVRRIAHGMGFRYRLHRKDLPGKPDLVFGPRRKIVLVHGCFWHGHDCPAGSKRVATRAAYWSAKIGGNVERDVRVEAALRSAGWSLCVVWECETRDAQAVTLKLKAFLDGEEEACSPG